MSGSATSMTGRYGAFYAEGTRVARCTQWAVSQKPASVSEWGDSDGWGWTCRAPGRRDVTFTAEGKFDRTNNQWDLFVGGDYAEAKLYLRKPAPGDVGSEDATYTYYFERAVCMEFNLTVNIDTEEVIGWTSSWGNDGPVTLPDSTTPDDIPHLASAGH